MIINVPLHNLKLIDFSGILKHHVEAELINQLDEYKLIKDNTVNIRNKHVKRLMYHYILKGLCDYVLSVKGENKIVIVYSETIVPTYQLNNYIDTLELQTFFNKLILKIIKMLPIKFLYTDSKFSTIRNDIRKNNGDTADIINGAKSAIDNFDISKYTFTKARCFAKRYGLLYMSNNFFQQIKNKQLIMC
jgi:hypothetical protein|tara:strand:+ start:540 stop:1109 length:570 start_codon:yes stop_codon:yes gene_type:complete